MVIRYNFHIENFIRYLVTGTVDSDVLESSLYIMKACPVMYTGLRQLRLFTTPIRLLIDPIITLPLQLQLLSTPTLPHPATTSLFTHPYISRCNFIPHPHIPLQLHSSHIPLQLHSSPISTYPAATSFLTHPYIFRCNSNSFPILENNCAVAVALLRCMR